MPADDGLVAPYASSVPDTATGHAAARWEKDAQNNGKKMPRTVPNDEFATLHLSQQGHRLVAKHRSVPDTA
eukprot:2190740-Rhodomonas_salina.1